METIIAVLVIGGIFGFIAFYVVKSHKKKNTPTPIPSPSPSPVDYNQFLSNVETVIRNPLTEDELETYFVSIRPQVEKYYLEVGFVSKFYELLDRYGIPYPY